VAVTGTDHRENLYLEWSPQNALALDDFSVASRHRAWWTCGNGHEWQAAIGDRNYKGTGCKQCGSGGTSAPEAALSEFVASLGETVRNHHRQIDPRFEYDVTIPDKRIAIEFNGLYWHGEEKKGASYHLHKSQAAQGAGWTLLYVWEDDWRDRRQIVERMIARKLGVSEEPRINARQLEFRAVTSRQAREFLETNHIQGFVGGSAYGALCDGEAIHAVMVFKKSQDGFRLERYATDAIVRGGFSKLFGRMVEATGAKRVATFADRGVSDGSLYALNGFKKDGEIPPDYMYRVGTKRVHKFNYRIKRFRDDPNLHYEDGLSERELAALNGLDRVYDAGKVRWVWTAAPVN
jgi:G:T-mismatch repair DNA endonuclease (very short patch repair protein)